MSRSLNARAAELTVLNDGSSGSSKEGRSSFLVSRLTYFQMSASSAAVLTVCIQGRQSEGEERITWAVEAELAEAIL
jgi:hypothetical protein